MTKEELNIYRDYGWNYFSLHAEQRLKTFHFFIALSAVIYGAIFTILKDLNNGMYIIPVVMLQTFLSFIFWKLDQRNRELIKHAENTLKFIEKSTAKDDDEILNLFSTEEENTIRKNETRIYCSYSRCFNLVFLAFGVGGWVIGALSYCV